MDGESVHGCRSVANEPTEQQCPRPCVLYCSKGSNTSKLRGIPSMTVCSPDFGNAQRMAGPCAPALRETPAGSWSCFWSPHLLPLSIQLGITGRLVYFCGNFGCCLKERNRSTEWVHIKKPEQRNRISVTVTLTLCQRVEHLSHRYFCTAEWEYG